MSHHPACVIALGAITDRGVLTPTSGDHLSTAQGSDHTEEDGEVGVPTQQPIDQLPTRLNHLAGQAHEGIHKRLELQAQLLSNVSKGAFSARTPPRSCASKFSWSQRSLAVNTTADTSLAQSLVM